MPRLVDHDVLLRAFRDDDLHVVAEASADPTIVRITTVPSEWSPAEGRAYLERQHQRATTGVGCSLAVATPEDDRAVGNIALWIADLPKGRAEIGYWIVASARGHRRAAAALDLLSRWALRALPLRRLSLFIEPWNTASIRTAERAGFDCDGLLRRWELVDGEARDMLAYGRFAT